MKCDNAIYNYLATDQYNHLSFKTKFHIHFCPKCKSEIQLLTENLKSIQKTSPFIMEKSVVNNVMNNITINQIQKKQKSISHFKWLMVGAIILLGIFLIPFNKQLDFLRIYFGAYFELPLVIVLGLTITLYSVIYIASNLEKIKDTIRIDKLLG